LKNYETIFILDPSLGDEKTLEEIEKAKSIITSANGEVLDVQKWGKRKLAYEIHKKREGIYALLRFKGTGTVVSELERSFRISEPVMRFLTVVDTGEPPAEVAEPEEGKSTEAQEATPESGSGPAVAEAGEGAAAVAESAGAAPEGAAGAATGEQAGVEAAGEVSPEEGGESGKSEG
jgi:small subunit ribosomal protein S6